MALLVSYALPGSGFIVLALWWTVNIFLSYFRVSETHRRAGFTSSLTYPLFCLPGSLKHYELEGALKILFGTIGFIAEICSAFEDGELVNRPNAQRATLYLAFALTGYTDIVIHHKCHLPEGVQYCSMVLFFMIEWTYLLFSPASEDMVDQLVHKLLSYVAGVTIATLLVEFRFRNQVLAPLARTYSVLCQGTWLWQAGWLLFTPQGQEWSHNRQHSHMIIVMAFTWHLGVNVLVMLLAGGAVAWVHQCRGLEWISSETKPLRLELSPRRAVDRTPLLDAHTPLVNAVEDLPCESDPEFWTLS